MGLKLTIPKQDNFLDYEFVDAYWKIDNIMFTNMNGESYVSFSLDAYPSRDASKKMLNSIEYSNVIPIGGTPRIAYEPRLWHWEACFKTLDVFEDGIPTTEAEQKDVLYLFVKQYVYTLSNKTVVFGDVLED